METPKSYISFGNNKFSVIYNGLPICADKSTLSEALAAAQQMRVKLAPVAWNGDRAEWVHTHTIA